MLNQTKMYQENLRNRKDFLFFENRFFNLPIQFRIDVQNNRFDGATKNLNVISNRNQELPMKKIKQLKTKEIQMNTYKSIR